MAAAMFIHSYSIWPFSSISLKITADHGKMAAEFTMFSYWFRSTINISVMTTGVYPLIKSHVSDETRQWVGLVTSSHDW